ncbi:alpha/beta hydrolase family esterase [Spirillospora sp. NBC_01491]|uniref:alpha/beta hydrolase family esterase n=1 Tax=Spirillospora sp. NBC_01491 TaxID=2976007 RepID=UPI002E307821|nr:PHB depolymerase family esterase [Spirillospora sp. NBC_01491]
MNPAAPAVLALTLLAGGALAGCAGSGAPARPSRGAAGPAPATGAPTGRTGGQAAAQAGKAAPSAGCGRQAAASTGRHSFGGRSYLLTLPQGGDRTPAPLIVDLHGLRSNGFQQALYGRLANAGPARGFVVAEPEGGPGRRGWRLPGMADGAADIAYVAALLDHLERTLCVDRRGEFAAGFSNGAGLSAALVCGLPGRLAGIAPVAGLNLARPCAGARPATIVAFHGTTDPIVPYGGGEPFGGDRRQVPDWMRPLSGSFALPPVAALAGRWARTFGCRATARDAPGPSVAHLARTGCRGGARVELYSVTGGGHTWPGSLPIGLGTTTGQIDATRLILDAFSRTRAVGR